MENCGMVTGGITIYLSPIRSKAAGAQWIFGLKTMLFRLT